MCGSAEGPTPEQLAHPPMTAFEKLIQAQWEREVLNQIERDSAFYSMRPVRYTERYITAKVRRGT